MDINNIIKIWGSLGETPSAQTFLDRLRGLRSVEDPDTLIGVLIKGYVHKNINPKDVGNVISTKKIVDFIQQSLSLEIERDKYPVVEDLLENMGIKKVSDIIPGDSDMAVYDYHIHYTPINTTHKVFIEVVGVPDEEIKSIREKIFNVLTRKMPYNTIDLIIPDEDPPKPGLKNQMIDTLIKSMRCLADADLVVFYGDFTKTKICCAELAVCKEYNIPYITMNESDINTGFKLDFNNYIMFMSDKIPAGCIFVSDCNYNEEVIVTKFPYHKFINLKTHPDSYMPKEITTYLNYAVINHDTASELCAEMDGLGDVISIARPNRRTCNN